jgi:hypothetical protein
MKELSVAGVAVAAAVVLIYREYTRRRDQHLRPYFVLHGRPPPPVRRGDGPTTGGTGSE